MFVFKGTVEKISFNQPSLDAWLFQLYLIDTSKYTEVDWIIYAATNSLKCIIYIQKMTGKFGSTNSLLSPAHSYKLILRYPYITCGK